MDSLSEHLDLLIQAPLEVLMFVYIYLNNKAVYKILDDYKTVIGKLIDKIR